MRRTLSRGPRVVMTAIEHVARREVSCRRAQVFSTAQDNQPIVTEVLGRELQGDVPIESADARRSREVHARHAATRDLKDDLVSTDLLREGSLEHHCPRI